MIYLRSVVVGVLAVVIAVIVTAISMVTILTIKTRNLPPGQAYGWDPITLFRNSLLAWVVVGLVFVLGFTWEYRRAITRH